MARFEVSANNSAWYSTTLKTYTYEYADEGTHTVTIRAIHQNGTVEKSPPTRTFTVDAVTANNSVLFYPRKNLTAAVNTTSQYQIRCENFNLVAGMQLALQYDPAQVEISGASASGSAFQKNGLSGDVLEVNQSATNKKVYAISALPNSKNIPFGVSGSDLLMTLSIKPKVKGQIPISIISAETFFKDSANVNLGKGELVNGLIEIQ